MKLFAPLGRLAGTFDVRLQKTGPGARPDRGDARGRGPAALRCRGVLVPPRETRRRNLADVPVKSAGLQCDDAL